MFLRTMKTLSMTIPICFLPALLATGKVVKVVTYKGCTKLRYCPLGPFTITTDLEERIRSNSECCCSDHCNKGGLRCMHCIS
ncbi:hypothetical protein JD844_005771 [Phrynosoma platyrhinos]|uniref:Activin types I and II receptor domain-containing protein n=1 Tax=Phrynosoma platyrhinos TaxID=52577 RepID=A0ABQ7TPT0_PHRPL|nr:hypothetical protein JD844_005771 [Phrynosoma platyrhinos]